MSPKDQGLIPVHEHIFTNIGSKLVAR